MALRPIATCGISRDMPERDLCKLVGDDRSASETHQGVTIILMFALVTIIPLLDSLARLTGYAVMVGCGSVAIPLLDLLDESFDQFGTARGLWHLAPSSNRASPSPSTRRGLLRSRGSHRQRQPSGLSLKHRKGKDVSQRG